MYQHQGDDRSSPFFFSYLKPMRAPIPLYKKKPVLRILLPFAAGILLQWYLQPSLSQLIIGALLSSLLLLPVFLRPKARYRWRLLPGIALQGILLFTGAAWLMLRDVRQEASWYGALKDPEAVVVRLTAPLQQKPASWKAEARILQARVDGHWQPASGGVLLYLRKDSLQPLPAYGQELLLRRPLELVRSSGNPGAFDYRRWCLFQGITHTSFLRSSDYLLLGKHGSRLQEIMIGCRDGVLAILQRYLPRGTGLAEALLIGYKDDLDKELLRTYSRTGVVHIIAISGMHLALVYGLLLLLTKPLQAQRLRWLRMALVLAGLWGFSFLAGGGPSILRAAVMFSFIAFGSLIGRKGNSINTLLLSALVLLLVNPFWLWDVGFQLSFTAVGGILLFYRPIYALYIPDNRLLDGIWKGSAVTLAAQVLTTPLSLYHFHQFPVLFLLANVLAVPLSGLLVYALLALLCLSFWPAAATVLGKGIALLIDCLNNYIATMERLPVAVWEGISISLLQTILLYGIIAALAWGPLQRRAPAWRSAAACLALMLCLRTASFWSAAQQRRLLVYGIPKMAAVELHDGRQLAFGGDRALLQDPLLRGYHLDGAHTAFRLNDAAQPLPAVFSFDGRVVVHLQEGATFPAIRKADLLILSHRPRLYLPQLLEEGRIGSLVIDASVPAKTAARWKEDCARAGVPCHDVSEKGAYMLEQ
jgi:competence protein ComEC